jgi:hypothetical protein
MNRINSTDGRPASRARLANELANNEGKQQLPSGHGVQPKISRRVKPLASWIATCVLLLSPCARVHAGFLKADVDFSNYDTPLTRSFRTRSSRSYAYSAMASSPASHPDSDEGDSRTEILKHLPSVGCLTILILIRTCAFSMASAAALFRNGTNVLSPSEETLSWMRH